MQRVCGGLWDENVKKIQCGHGEPVKNRCAAAHLGRCDCCYSVKEAASREGGHEGLPQCMAWGESLWALHMSNSALPWPYGSRMLEACGCAAVTSSLCTLTAFRQTRWVNRLLLFQCIYVVWRSHNSTCKFEYFRALKCLAM